MLVFLLTQGNGRLTRDRELKQTLRARPALIVPGRLTRDRELKH